MELPVMGTGNTLQTRKQMTGSTGSTFSVCGMCTVRCPIEVETDNGEIQFVPGNPNLGAINGALCARAADGKALVNNLMATMEKNANRRVATVDWRFLLCEKKGITPAAVDGHLPGCPDAPTVE